MLGLTPRVDLVSIGLGAVGSESAPATHTGTLAEAVFTNELRLSRLLACHWQCRPGRGPPGRAGAVPPASPLRVGGLRCQSRCSGRRGFFGCASAPRASGTRTRRALVRGTSLNLAFQSKNTPVDFIIPATPLPPTYLPSQLQPQKGTPHRAGDTGLGCVAVDLNCQFRQGAPSLSLQVQYTAAFIYPPDHGIA